MQFFRNMQEPESTDITQYPGYTKLSGDKQKKVAETYTNVYNNNQGKLGFKIAHGIAFATAKKMCESFAGAFPATRDASPGTIADDELGEGETRFGPCRSCGTKGPLMSKGQLVCKKCNKNKLKEGDAEDFQAGNDNLVGMTEVKKKDPKCTCRIGGKFGPKSSCPKHSQNEDEMVSGSNPEEGGAAQQLRLNHALKCVGCGAIHPMDSMCFDGRIHSEAGMVTGNPTAVGAGGGNGAADILKQNHAAMHASLGLNVEETDPIIDAAARYLTNRAKISGLMESLEEGAGDIQKKNLENKCPDCGSVKKNDKCPNCDSDTDVDDKKADDDNEDSEDILKKNHKDKGLKEEEDDDPIMGGLKKHANRQLLKYAAGHHIFCPSCEKVLDHKNTVIATHKGTGKTSVSCGDCYDKGINKLKVRHGHDVINKHVHDNFDVVDGRSPKKQAKEPKPEKPEGALKKPQHVKGQGSFRFKPGMKVESEGLDEKHIGFKALEGKLERTDKSKESAGAIAASIGNKKYGKNAMHKAAASHTPLGENDFSEEVEQMWAENFYPAKPLEECCGRCTHPKSFHEKGCQTCNMCESFSTVNESSKKKGEICFCGHEFGHHGNNGCKSCKNEGIVTSSKAAHQFLKKDYKERFEDEYHAIFNAQQGKINTSLANASLNWLPEGKESKWKKCTQKTFPGCGCGGYHLNLSEGYDDIGPGDHVVINHPLRGRDTKPQQGKGRVVMKGPAGWVLNMGGKYGTPGIATPENYVSHRKAAKKTVKEDEGASTPWEKTSVSSSTNKHLPKTHTMWSRLHKGNHVFTLKPHGKQPEEDSGSDSISSELSKLQDMKEAKFAPEAIAASKKAWKATEKARNSQSVEDHVAAAKAHKSAALTHAPGNAAKDHHEQAEVHNYLADFTKKYGAELTKHQLQTMKEMEIEEEASPDYHKVLTRHCYKHVESGDHERYEHPNTSHVNVYKSGDWEHKGKNKSLIANTGSDAKSLDSHLKKVARAKVSGANRKEKDDVMRSLGLNKVKGSVSGKTYWESEENPIKEEIDPLMASALNYINQQVSNAGGPLIEGDHEHEQYKDHTKNPYHQILNQHGFQHASTEHKKNRFASNNPKADYTEHLYTHPNHRKSHVIVTQEHGAYKNKKHSFLHRHEQSNGIMAPSTGDSKSQLHRSLSYHYGVPKGMEPPELTAWEKKYPHGSPSGVPHYKINEETMG